MIIFFIIFVSVMAALITFVESVKDKYIKELYNNPCIVHSWEYKDNNLFCTQCTKFAKDIINN